jgi:hypothetical protein
VKESPSENPPHVTQYPVPVITVVSCFIGKAWLITLYPCIGIGSRKVPVMFPQFFNEAIGTKILVTLRVKLYGRNKGGIYVCCAWHDYLTIILYLYTVLLIGDADQVDFANRMIRFLLTVKITRLLTDMKVDDDC